MSTARWTKVGLGALAGAAALGVVLVLSHAAAQPTHAAPAVAAAPVAPASNAKAANTAPARPSTIVAPKIEPATDSAPAIEEVLQAQGATTPGTIDLLVAGLASEDAVVVAEAANGLVARGALSALPSLVEIDVVARPWTAPSIIYAIGHIAAKADAEDRALAVDRLLALLASEKERASPEASANLLHIYEALGHTGDARAIAPLERELVDARVATAPKVVIVQALVALGARQSRATLERTLAELAPTAIGDDFEAVLRRDLAAAIREALVQLS